MATAALKTALDIGLRVFPVSREKKKPCIKAWPALASGDPDRLEAWSRQFGGCNWGALTGAESDAIVIDIDGPMGRASIERLQSNFGALPPTLSVRTGRLDGGQQLYYRWPKGRELHSSQGAIAAGIDVKAWRSFAVIPDSLHKSGRRYEWENDLDRAPMPEWFVGLVEQNWIQRHERKARQAAPRPQPTEAELMRKCGMTRVLLPGRRHAGLLRVAGKLRRKGAGFDRILAAVEHDNRTRCLPPLPDGEIIRIADSVMRYAPAAGPDPLDLAWDSVALPSSATAVMKVAAIAVQLQCMHPGHPVALPVERIASLIGVHHTLVARCRRRLVADGILHSCSRYVFKEKAATFFVIAPIECVSTHRVLEPPLSPIKQQGGRERTNRA